MTENDTWYKCTVCGREGTVGRCCGEETRIPLNEAARQEQARIQREKFNEMINKLNEREALQSELKFYREKGFVEGILLAVQYLGKSQGLKELAKYLAMEANVKPEVASYYRADKQDIEYLEAIFMA